MDNKFSDIKVGDSVTLMIGTHHSDGYFPMDAKVVKVLKYSFDVDEKFFHFPIIRGKRKPAFKSYRFYKKNGKCVDKGMNLVYVDKVCDS